MPFPDSMSIDVAPPFEQPEANRFPLSAYLICLAGVPVLMVLAALIVIPSQWFLRHSGDVYFANIGYGDRLHGADCQILVYGDSTAMVGLNPQLIRSRTGLTTCNIAEAIGMTAINGTMIIDKYLRQNPRPRYLVMFYAPENFDPKSQRAYTPMFEGMTYRMRQPDRFSFALQHFNDFINWTSQGTKIAVLHLFTKPAGMEAQHIRDQTLGQLPIYDSSFTHSHGPKTIENCELMTNHISGADKTWVRALRSKYEALGITVLIDSSPIPDCDRAFPFLQRQLRDLTNNRLESMDVSLFLEGGRHVNAAGSALISNKIADQIVRAADSTSGAN